MEGSEAKNMKYKKHEEGYMQKTKLKPTLASIPATPGRRQFGLSIITF